MKWRALIVDDERLARVALKGLLAERDDVEVVGEADSTAAARPLVAQLKPDVVFLDIQMPGETGFGLCDESLEAEVVFCTAYDQYAVKAFEVNALDYLLKPVSPEQLDRAIQRLGAPASAPAPSGKLTFDDQVALRESHAMRLVPVRDITYLQAADDYSEVHLAAGPTAMVEVTLRRWEERLPDEFVRIHRSTLVNLKQVESIEHDDGKWEVVVKGGVRLAVSRRMANDLKARLN